MLKRICLSISILACNVTLKGAVALQAHQTTTVDYLLKHPEQKGLLIYHSLGSGKTYLALAYAEALPQRKVIVFLPRFLKANWLSQMDSFGVKDKNRYELISYEETDKFKDRDLKNTILIIDEVHKLIEKVRHRDSVIAKRFSDLYFQFRNSFKILALTGTPIFSETSDIAFIGNLVTGEDQFPYDQNKFRIDYMKISPIKSLVRGHVMESKLMSMAIPFFTTLSAITLFAGSAPLAIPVIAFAGSSLVPFLNEQFPAGRVTFRDFDTDKLKDFTSKNVSFYAFQTQEDANYPKKEIHEMSVHYSLPQTHFFISFADEDLSEEQLRMLLAEEGVQVNSSYLHFHSADIQRQFLFDPKVGREIGNFALKGEGGNLVEAPKFVKILNIIKEKPGQVAVYSNYFANGVLKFKEFLDRHNFENTYIVLSPEMTIDEQIRAMEEYNSGRKRILLIHPEITEGISLKGTEQLHILEPIANHALLEQVIGRAIRFQSHTHLPKNRQMVHTYLWKSHITLSDYWPTEAGRARRKHWQKRFAEINPSMWTKGILEVDRNYFRKDETADSRVTRDQSNLEGDAENFKKLLTQYSIETKG